MSWLEYNRYRSAVEILAEIDRRWLALNDDQLWSSWLELKKGEGLCSSYC
jgi:hypothetical protein